MDRPYTVGLICARGGSKGVPRKNLRTLGGKPLIGWAIEVAKKCPSITRVVVSTEDREIAEVAKSFGAEVPFFRPDELAQDTSSELLAWQHCLRTLEEQDGKAPEYLVSVPATSPMRDVEDVENCFALLKKSGADFGITVTEAHRNPYFNMIKFVDGWAKIAVIPDTPMVRRQDAPPLFDITTVAYAARARYVLESTKLLDGKVSAAIVPDERAVDIDTELDFAFAEFLLARKQKMNPQS